MRRIFHPWHRWECVSAGMYASAAAPPMTPDEAEAAYASFLRDGEMFSAALLRVLVEWPVSCEHFLSNPFHNRIAWLGQASMCIATAVPARFRGGFHRLTDAEQGRANGIAWTGLKRWLAGRTEDGFELHSAVDTEDAVDRIDGDSMRARVRQYLSSWERRGYAECGIPDTVPSQIAAHNLAPSYRAVCVALLRNDHGLVSIGGVPRGSAWYGALKRIEIAGRETAPDAQLSLFA